MTPEAKTMLDSIRDLAPSISARSAEIDAGRRLPLDLLAQLTAAGCFRMFVPKSHGGLDIDVPDQHGNHRDDCHAPTAPPDGS